MKLGRDLFFFISSELWSQMISLAREHPQFERERAENNDITSPPLGLSEGWRLFRGGDTLSDGATVKTHEIKEDQHVE